MILKKNIFLLLQNGKQLFLTAFCQVLVHLTQWFQRKYIYIYIYCLNQSTRKVFFHWPITNKTSLWPPYQFYDRYEIWKFCTRSPIHNSYKVAIYCASQFHMKKCIKFQPIRDKNCTCRPCVLSNRNEMNISCRGPSIDASYQVSVHLGKWFQKRRFKCEKATDDGKRMTSDYISSYCVS